MKKKKYIGDFVCEQFQAAASFNSVALTILTLTSAGVMGVMGLLFMKIWGADSTLISSAMLGFYGISGIIGLAIFFGCLGGFWLKLKLQFSK